MVKTKNILEQFGFRDFTVHTFLIIVIIIKSQPEVMIRSTRSK